VKSHLGRLYEKLGVSDRAAAVAEAMRRGIVE
jgi:two-component system nitrate/nitrite response regulator NarL